MRGIFLLTVSLCLYSATSAVKPDPLEITSLEDYSFEDFVFNFRKSYDSTEEYEERRDIFHKNLERIFSHNREQATKKGGYLLGINRFADKGPHEMHYGYNKGSHPAWNQAEAKVSPSRRELSELPFDLTTDVSELPDSVDWRTNGIVTPVKDQGMCGSCWAFASTATLESHIALNTGVLFSLSTQELVSCVENPDTCGGTGGCAGATSELAYDYLSVYGALEEDQLGYTSYYGHESSCPSTFETNLRLPRKFPGAVALIEGFVQLPSNDYVALMNAVAKAGPVAVSVAASPWSFYSRGVFDDVSDGSPPANRDVNHLTVLVGYGTDQDTGEDYWLVRNSWSPTWGEGGYIRLKRTDPSTLADPDDDCGMDTTPADGVACTKDEDGNPVVPPAAKTCGTSGILFDSVLPVGGSLLL
mmetsp:Transcript_25325/g.38931  ORF Transcript_25325/g.38931 Transcript_25325/m.38931 type:complete len:416 (+) Transcript_25325:19-1266(+)